MPPLYSAQALSLYHSRGFSFELTPKLVVIDLLPNRLERITWSRTGVPAVDSALGANC